MSSYERFLGAQTTEVLPYFGGSVVTSAARRLQVTTSVDPGWWRFVVTGRRATPEQAVRPNQLDSLPAVHGHVADGNIAITMGVLQPLWFADPEPLRFAVVVARRWHSGEVLMDYLGFETEAEAAARHAFDSNTGLSGIKGVPATLRTAFGFAVMRQAAAARGSLVSATESRPFLRAVSELGLTHAHEVLDQLAARRAQASTIPVEVTTTWTYEPYNGDPLSLRLQRALDRSQAELLDKRRLDHHMIEVRFRFMHERFSAVIDERTLHVYDAGICLAGADEQLTLESLPAVIREAIDNDLLVVTR
jgi:hypothetical protein